VSFADLGFAKVDLERDARQGAPEAVLAEGKTPDEIEAIVRALRDGGASSVLVTRADEAARAAVRRVDSGALEHERARCAWIPVAPLVPAGRVAIVSAGTSDAPAAHEARIRAELCGTHVELHEDCGVAGLDRILSVAPALREADCVIVVAGMDAALASVVGGIDQLAHIREVPVDVLGARHDDLDAARGDAVPYGPPDRQVETIDSQSAHVLGHPLGASTGVDQGGQQHVARGAADAVDVGDARHEAPAARRAMRAAIVPAPKPSSMLTQATPAAHEDSIASSAVTPSNAAP